MSKLDEKIKEYVDTFHENVPLFVMPSMTDEELIARIERCLESGKPIEVDIKDGVLY